MTHLVETLRNKTAGILKGGGEKTVKKHVSKGKLFVRDRIKLLLDKNSAFLELSTLAANNMYEANIQSAGVITGIGKISG